MKDVIEGKLDDEIREIVGDDEPLLNESSEGFRDLTTTSSTLSESVNRSFRFLNVGFNHKVFRARKNQILTEKPDRKPRIRVHEKDFILIF